MVEWNTISRLAKIILVVPATSAPSERMFSVSGHKHNNQKKNKFKSV